MPTGLRHLLLFAGRWWLCSCIKRGRSVRRHYGPFWVVSYCFLSHYEIKFAMIPAFDKVSIPNLSAFIGCILILRRFPRLWHRFGLPEVLLLMLLVGPFMTSEFNTDPLVFGSLVLPPETHYDAVSAVLARSSFFCSHSSWAVNCCGIRQTTNKYFESWLLPV